MKDWILKYKEWIFVFLIGMSVSWPLFAPGYFSHHDDLQVLRVYEMRQCIEDFQIPCRWSKNLGFGNGFPIYNYYGVFPYYIGGLISFVTGYILSAKILFFVAVFGAAVSMWLLTRELFDKYSAAVATSLYVYAPYRALDIYVRGALAEAWSIALLPLVMYGFLKLSKESRQRWFLLATFSLLGLLTSHNIMTIFFGPILVMWLIWCGVVYKAGIGRICLSFALGVLLSSFFLFPAFLEKGLIQNESLTRFDLDFRVHFVTITQLFFSRFWGYGASVEGPWDGLSFQVGWPLWWMIPMAVVLLVIRFFKKDFQSNMKIVVLLLVLIVIFLLSVFMTHNKSAFIWEEISLLHFAQFPWRFLAVSIFSASLIGAGFVYLLPKQLKMLMVIGIVLLSVVFNVGYFQPDKYYFESTDANKLSGSEWDRQTSSIILDYLPKTAFEPREKAPAQPIVVSGEGEVSGYVAKSNSYSFKFITANGAKVELPIFYFPGWDLKINNNVTSIKHDNLLGRINFEVPGGEYKVEGRFGDTMVRSIGNWMTLLGIVLVVIYLRYAKNKHIRF